MKISPDMTFLNLAVVAEPAATVQKTSSRKWLLIVSGGLLLVSAYGFLLVRSAVQYFQPEFTVLADGWVLLTCKSDQYSVELPQAGRKQTSNGQITYHSDLRSNGVYYTITSASVASQLLTRSETKVLRDIMQADGTQDSVKGAISGILQEGTHWIDYRVTTSNSQMAFRRRVLLRDKMIVTITLTSEEHNLATPEVDRIMNSARFLR